MKILILVALFGPALVLSQGGDTSCPGQYTGNPCYSKSQKGWVGDYFGYTWIGDGPCFTDDQIYGGAPSCFTSDGNAQDKCDCDKAACNCGSAGASTSTPETDCTTSKGDESKCFSKKQKGAEVSSWGYTYTQDDGPCFTDNSIYDGFPSCITTAENTVTRCNCDNSKCGCTKFYDSKCSSTVNGMASACGTHVCRRGGITQSERDLIVNYHNELRNTVYNGNGVGSGGKKLPKASSTPQQLTWDEDLAAGAQAWADKCADGHDSNKKRKKTSNKNDAVGQNAAAYWSQTYDSNFKFQEMIKGWYDEIKDVTEAMIKSYPDITTPVIGHFTQVAWAKSIKIGCGLANYAEDVEHGQVIYRQRLICNYFPSGNYIGQEVYPTD